MAYTQADIDALRERITRFAGVSSTQFADQKTDFDMQAARDLLAEMERQVNGQATRTRKAATSKGV